MANHLLTGCQDNQWGKHQSFQQLVLRQLYIHMQKNESGPQPHTILKFHSKRITGLHIRARIVKRLEENVGVTLHGLGLSNDFLDTTLKVQISKENR